ncbi:MAG: hypothetical protein WBL41_08115, partial [Terracidiphilus sp.]
QGDGTLTVIKENSPADFTVEQAVFTPARAKTHTLDTKTGNIYLITAEYGPTPAAPPSPAPPAAPSGLSAGTAPPPGAPPAGGSPTFMRGPRAPMIPGSFQILVVGK